MARERITQCFRDALFDEYRSSNHSKKKRRREQLKKGRRYQSSKATKSSDDANLQEKSTEALGPLVTDAYPNFSLKTLTQNTTEQDRSWPPSSQIPTRKPEEDFSHILNRRPSGIPDPLASSQGLGFQGLVRKQLELVDHSMTHPEAFSAQNVPLTLLQERGNSESKDYDPAYPRNWFITDSSEFNSIFANGNPFPTPSAQPADLLFGNLFNQQGARVSNPSTVAEGSSSSHFPGMPLSYIQQNVSSPHYTSDSPFDLSLEPTPIAENISRRHLEHRKNFQS